MSIQHLGWFGHHPTPAIDFCIEVECCENAAYDLSVGNGCRQSLRNRIDKAMSFRVGGDAGCIDAKHALRKLENALILREEEAYMAKVIAERARVPA